MSPGIRDQSAIQQDPVSKTRIRVNQEDGKLGSGLGQEITCGMVLKQKEKGFDELLFVVVFGPRD